jgi:hypothetical protein
MMSMMLIILAVIVMGVLLLIITQGSRHRDSARSQQSADWLVDATTLDQVDRALHKLTDIYSVRDDEDDADDVPEKPKHTPSLELAAGIRDMLDEGRKSEAIEIYQKFTGVDQYTAQAAVEHIERELRLNDEPDEGDGYLDEDDETFHSGKLSN